MGTLNLTDPVNGTTADASVIASNNAAVKTVVNGGIDHTNIAANAAILTSQLNLPYAAYTPTWTASGTAPAIGNAAVTARFTQVGKVVFAYGQIAFGSTSTFGTGSYTFALPVTAAGSAVNATIAGAVILVDASASATGLAQVQFSSPTLMLVQFGATYLGTSTSIGQTAPWTWAVSDTIAWSITYEAA